MDPFGPSDSDYIPSAAESDESDSDLQPRTRKRSSSAQNFPSHEITNFVFVKEVVDSEDYNNCQNDPLSSAIRGRRGPNFCIYCKRKVLNFARHIQRNHSSEEEVAKIISLPPGSKERTELLTILRKRGNFLSNSYECVKPVKKANLPNTKHVPCKYCLGFYTSNLLYRHVKKCKLKTENSKTYSHLTDAQNALLLRDNMPFVDTNLVKSVFPRMMADEVSLVAKKDQLICMFGAQYIKTNQAKRSINVCSRKMRELSKLLIEMREHKPQIKSFIDVLQPENFDLVVSIAKKLSKYDEAQDRYIHPTFAFNIKSAMKQCCDIVVESVLKKNHIGLRVPAVKTENACKIFKTLVSGSWHIRC